MDIGWILWGIWVFSGVAIEVYAIKTNKYDTLSEKLWKVSAVHWAFRVALIVGFGWALIHIGGGECALGICP